MTNAVTVIYIVDADDSVRTAITRLMQSSSMFVQVFPSVETFLCAARPTAFDCMVVDIDSIDKSQTKLQRSLQDHGCDTPLILLTSLDDEHTRKRARQLGATAYFLKPVDGQALLDAVRFALNSE